MGFWSSIDNPKYADNKSAYEQQQQKERLRDTNNLSNYNPITDKFYSNR